MIIENKLPENRFNTPEFAELANIKPEKEDGTFIIPVSWSVYSTVSVKAANLQEALMKAEEKLDDLPLPSSVDESEYIDGSYQINVNDAEEAEVAQDYRQLSTISIDENGEIHS